MSKWKAGKISPIEEAAEIQTREENRSCHASVCTGPGALPRPGMRWGRGGMLTRMLLEAALEAFEVFMSILCFHPLSHTPRHHPGPAGLHSRLSPLNL